jgi:hypothetical protein
LELALGGGSAFAAVGCGGGGVLAFGRCILQATAYKASKTMARRKTKLE